MRSFEERIFKGLIRQMDEARLDHIERIASGAMSHDDYRFWSGYVKALSDLKQAIIDVRQQTIEE